MDKYLITVTIVIVAIVIITVATMMNIAPQDIDTILKNDGVDTLIINRDCEALHKIPVYYYLNNLTSNQLITVHHLLTNVCEVGSPDENIPEFDTIVKNRDCDAVRELSLYDYLTKAGLRWQYVFSICLSPPER